MDADAELMRRVSQGDAAAFRALVERHEKSMFNFFLRLTGSAEDAEDLTQELFVALYGASRGYRPDAPFRAYLYKIASNMVASHMRRKRLRAALSIDEMAAGGFDVASDRHDDNPAAVFEARQMHRRYEAALARLPHDWRIALELRVGRELSYREIAKAMGKSVSAVESILFRTRERIAEKLWNIGQEREDT
jgi:RNA polymerase sigma-70 factor (ECF subfamily)